MLHELQPGEFERVLPLFHEAHLDLVIQGAIAGNSPARIWVDNLIHPESAYLWDKTYCHYFAGCERNNRFNTALKQLLNEVIAPEARSHGCNAFKLDYATDDWEEIVRSIFTDSSPVKGDRCFYRLKRLEKMDWRNHIPSGFRMTPIDQDLLNSTCLRNIRELIDEIELCWNSVEGFLRNGFGFCLLHEDEIVSRCTAEYVSENRCGIGIETTESYRQQGFATLTASAFAEHCVSNRITPHWDSWKNNVGSIKVSEKVGFELISEYAVYFGFFGTVR